MYVEYNKLTIYAFISRTGNISSCQEPNNGTKMNLISERTWPEKAWWTFYQDTTTRRVNTQLNTCTLRSLQVGVGVSAATGDLHGGHSEDLLLLSGWGRHLHSPLAHQAWHRRRPIHPKRKGSWPTWAHCRRRCWLHTLLVHALHQYLSDTADQPISVQHPQRQAQTWWEQWMSVLNYHKEQD